MDGSIAEIFLGTGEALIVRFYPMGEEPWRLQARASGDGPASFEAQVWELDPLSIKSDDDASGAFGRH